MSHNYKKIIYDKYYSVHTKNLYGNFSNESVKKQYKFWDYYFSEYLSKDFTIQILDAGCGNGGFVSWLFDLGYKNSKGVDISKEMIDLGKSLKIDNLYHEDLFDYLRKNKNVFDIIFCRDVLEHFKKDEIVEIFSLFYDSLKRGGKIIIQGPNGFSPNYGKIFHGDFTHETIFSEAVLNQIAKATGFNSIKVKEVTPVPHGFKSTIRFILWKLLRMKYQLYQLIENGNSKGYFSQNLIAEIIK